ncbi:MAG: preprotein translocase subunit SecG [Sphingopyxis sp.]|nr:preprotein translocase subunit SecG [Sphingopyxis sp.]
MGTLFTFLLVVQALIAAAMIGVILMQRSEGGGLGVGGSPAGMLSARGAADFLTRATTILAMLFVGLSIVLAALAATGGSGATKIDTSLSKSGQAAPGAAVTGAAPAAAPALGSVPLSDDPLAAGAAAGEAAPKEAAPPAKQGVPLEQ